MAQRLVFIVVTGFWLVMNYLLWRSEFGPGKNSGSSISTRFVWQKILTSPDSSGMEVFQGRDKIGFCRWVANVGEEIASGQIQTEEVEGMVRKLTHYTLDLEGSVRLVQFTNLARFSFAFAFSTNQSWESSQLRLAVRPTAWELRASALEQKVSLKVEDPDDPWEKTFTFQQLANPQSILQELGGPMGAAMLGVLIGSAGPTAQTNGNPFSFGLRWDAHHDSIRIGRSNIQVYRLVGRLLERYQVVLIASRAGEILRIDLPGDIILVNDAFPMLRPPAP